MKPFTALNALALAGLLSLGLGTGDAQALCDQTLHTPVAALANTVRQEGDQVLGFWPDLLRSIGGCGALGVPRAGLPGPAGSGAGVACSGPPHRAGSIPGSAQAAQPEGFEDETGACVVGRAGKTPGMPALERGACPGPDGLPSPVCRFEFSVVPRARLELLFELGQVPVMLAAVRTERRDGFGEFVPLLDTRPALLSLNPELPALQHLRELAPPRRVAVVRGFDFGLRYRQALDNWRRDGQLVVEADIPGALRALQAGLADYAVLLPAHAQALAQREARFAELGTRLRTEFLAELPWHTTGAYLSHRALPAAERSWLRQRLQAAAESGEVWRQLGQHYPAEAMAGSMRPL